MNYKEIGPKILKAVGGKENVNYSSRDDQSRFVSFGCL